MYCFVYKNKNDCCCIEPSFLQSVGIYGIKAYVVPFPPTTFKVLLLSILAFLNLLILDLFTLDFFMMFEFYVKK